MKIIVNEKNKEKINAAIKAAEGRATARTIKFYDIECAIERIEKKLGIPAAHMRGIRALVDVNAQKFPAAYNFTPESTHFRLERFASGWAVTDIWRGRTEGPKKTYQMILTDEAKEAIINSKLFFE